MKRLTLILVVLLTVAVIGLGIWVQQSRIKAAKAAELARMPRRGDMPHVLTIPHDWRDYHDTRVKVLQENPDLDAEYKSIHAEMTAEQKKIEAAMIKSDPKVEPVLAKLAMIRQHNALPPGPVLGAPKPPPVPMPKPAPKDEYTLTREQWREMQTDRQAVLQAQPEIRTKLADLSHQMRDFQTKLNALMIIENPSVAPTIDKLENPGAPQMMPLPPPASGH